MTQKPAFFESSSSHTFEGRPAPMQVAEVHLNLSEMLKAAQNFKAQSATERCRSSSSQRRQNVAQPTMQRKELRYSDRTKHIAVRLKSNPCTAQPSRFDTPAEDSDPLLRVLQRESLDSQEGSSPVLCPQPSASRPQTAARKLSPDKHSKQLAPRCGTAAKAHPPSDTRTPLYQLSVLERNKLWLFRKQQKLEAEREAKAATSLNGCTFTPVIYTRVPHKMQERPVEDLLQFTQGTEQEIEVQNVSPCRFQEGLASMGTTASTRSPERKTHRATLSLHDIPPVKDLSPFRVQFRHFNVDSFVGKQTTRR